MSWLRSPLPCLLLVVASLLLACCCPSALCSVAQLEAALKASRALDAATVGHPTAALLGAALGEASIPLTNPTFTLDTDTLFVSAEVTAWGSHSGPLHLRFWYVGSALEVAAEYSVGLDSVGGLPGLWSKLSPGSTPPSSLSAITYAPATTAVVGVDSIASNLAIGLYGNVSSASEFGRAAVAAVGWYSNPQPVVFDFAYSPSSSASEPGSLSGHSFVWHIPGTYQIWPHVQASDVVLTAGLDPIHIGLTSTLTIQSKHGSYDMLGSAQWTEQQPVVFSARNTKPWQKPFGISWLTFEQASMTLTVGHHEDSLVLEGTGPVSWNTQEQATFELELSGTMLDQFLLLVQGFPLNSLPDTYTGISGNGAPAVLGGVRGGSSKEETVTLALSTASGQYPEGLTIDGKVVLYSGDLYSAHHLLERGGSPGSTTFLIHFFAPIFSSSPQDIQFSLTVIDPYIVQTGLSVTRCEFQVDVSPDTMVELSADFSWQPKHQASPITFTSSATFTSGVDSLDLQGALTSPWSDPFGLHYLTISSATFNLDLSPSTVTFDCSGNVLFTFATSSDQVQFSLQTGPAADDVSFSVTFTRTWSLPWMMQQVAPGVHVDRLGDVNLKDTVTFGFSITTGGSAAGVALTSSGTLVKGSKTEKEIMIVSPSHIPEITWTVGIHFPIFEGNPQDWSISLTFADQIAVKPNLWFEDIEFSVNPTEVTLGGEWKAQIHHNPGILTFEVNGDVGIGGFGIEGEMLGSWDDPFGMKFILSNVATKVQFGTTGLEEFALGATTQFGNHVIEFAGGVAAPDFLESFLIAGINDTEPAVSVADMCLQWNHMMPDSSIDMKIVPKEWNFRPQPAIREVLVEIAGSSGQFGPYQYQSGFHIVAVLDLVGLELDVDAGCTLEGGLSCSFEWNVHMNKTAFDEALHHALGFEEQRLKEAGLEVPYTSFHLNDVNLTEWTAPNLHVNINPRWQIDLDVDLFGHHKHHMLDFRTSLLVLHGDFKQFFDNWIKHVFGLCVCTLFSPPPAALRAAASRQQPQEPIPLGESN